MRVTFLLLSTLLSLANPVRANSMDAALAALDQGQYQQAYALLLPLAENENAEAQYRLGRMLVEKVLPTEAPEKGIPWLQRALLNEHRDAARMLGQMHMSGHLLPMDSERALHYMKIVERLTPEGEEEECD